MVVYKSKLIKTEPVYGEAENQIIEVWATFKIEERELEVFLDNFYILSNKDILEGIGKNYDVNIVLMTYDVHRINIKEKMLKQISTFPKMPGYYLLGEIVEKEEERKIVVVDCGLKIECDVSGMENEKVMRCLRVGDWVFVYGDMYGEIVK